MVDWIWRGLLAIPRPLFHPLERGGRLETFFFGQTVELLLNLVEQLNSKVKQLEEKNQKLRDENNRLKGEQGKPDIKASKKKEFQKDHSSEKERKTPKEHSKTSKNETIKVDREEIVFYDRS